MLADDELYDRFLTGDTSAYDALLLRHGDGLTVYLYGCLHDWQDAEDLMIEAFARIMAKRPALRTGNFKAYLYRTARNLATRHHERRGRLRTFSLEELDEEALGADPLVDELLRDEERRQVLHACLDRIEPELKEALWLVYAEGLSYTEAAHVMGVTRRRIDRLLERGKQHMRTELAKEGVTDENR